ncbi:MAG: type II toxin-antitoxin system VapC family toxin [Blastochloris sp.]|nr:type II toxin-antitoxin system VapC family toxin [Blastochloris sp.]
MALLLDSSILLHCLRHPSRMPQGESADDDFFLSIISADELLRVIPRAASEHERTRRRAWVEAVLEHFPVLPIDRATTRMHADILHSMEKKKIRLGLHESWIAATCITHGLTLITLHPEAFQKSPRPQNHSLPLISKHGSPRWKARNSPSS